MRLGTTRGTTALLTRTGARTALVTTAGLEDVYLIGDQDRPELFSLDIHKQLSPFSLDLTLAAPDEKIIVLFGASGAGKSLTLASIAGFITPDAGHIQLGERLQQSCAPPRN